MGRPAQTPSPGERARALALLARLIENSAVVPLKLGSSLGEQPDFVCSPEVLRYVYALRGDRNFKTGPLTVGNEKVTPLSLHCWQAIEQQGALDVAALQPILGRDITEAAIARALQELWAGLYIFPMPGADGEPARWELLVRRFPKPVAAGACTGHAAAQSAMISLYLQASVAVREEELLAFLSPLAPQSKLREVIHGLGSMRQLDILDIGGRAHVALQGGLLPEMVAQLSEEFLAAPATSTAIEGEAEIAMEAELESEAEMETKSGSEMNSEIEIESLPQSASHAGRSQLVEGADDATRSTIKKFVPKKNAPRPADASRPGAGRFVSRGSGEDRGPRRPFSGGLRSGGSGSSRPASGYAPRPRSFGASSFAASADETPGGRPGRLAAGRPGPDRSGPREFGRDRNRGAARGAGSRESFSRDRGDRGSKPRAPKGYAAKERGMGERAKRWEKTGEVPAAPSSSSRPFAPKSSGFKSSGFKPGGSKFSSSKPFGSRFGSSKPWQSKSSVPGGGAHEERPQRWKKFDGSSDSRSGARKPYASKSSGFNPRGGKPWAAKPARSKDGKSFPHSSKPGRRGEAGESAKPWQGSRPGRSDRTGGDQPGGRKPWASKGAESRIGSAKSYAARSAVKPHAKTDGARPWVKRSATSAAREEIRPKRRELKEGSETSPREKSGTKPFWAKNPRGGKGSSAAGRTNRPRGKKTTRKSGKKK